MKITKEMRIGLLGIVSLYLSEENKSAMELTAEHSIEKPFFEKVFSKLRRSGLVDVVKGPGGGYRLGEKKDPSVWEVFDVLLNKNLKDNSFNGDTREVIFVNDFLKDNETNFINSLKNKKISDIIKEKRSLKVAS